MLIENLETEEESIKAKPKILAQMTPKSKRLHHEKPISMIAQGK